MLRKILYGNNEEKQSSVTDIEQNQILREIAQLLNERNPIGELFQFNIAVTDRATVLDKDNDDDNYEFPWFSFTLRNDGPNAVYFDINKNYLARKTSVQFNEEITIDFGKNKIQKLNLYCDSGETASVRIYAKK